MWLAVQRRRAYVAFSGLLSTVGDWSSLVQQQSAWRWLWGARWLCAACATVLSPYRRTMPLSSAPKPACGALQCVVGAHRVRACPSSNSNRPAGNARAYGTWLVGNPDSSIHGWWRSVRRGTSWRGSRAPFVTKPFAHAMPPPCVQLLRPSALGPCATRLRGGGRGHALPAQREATGHMGPPASLHPPR